MLDELEPDEFMKWRAAFDVEPQIAGWEQTATITANVVNAIQMIANMFIKDSKKLDAVQLEDVIPHLVFEDEKSGGDSIQNFHNFVRSKFGV